jgi:phosphatidylglycerol:prolipoprotein diacylglycerol transferase
MQPSIHIIGISIKTFGLAFGIAFLICGAVLARRLQELGKPADWAYEIIFAALAGGLVGARLWYVAQHTSDLRAHALSTLFGGSGLVWYGGAIGGAVAVLAWAARRRWLGIALLDLCAPGLALGYAAGRIGCQVSGDGDYGKPWHGPWAMAYPHGTVPTDVTVHPTPIYETLTMGLVALLLWHLRDRLAPGRLFALYLVLAGVERFLVEFIRRNSDAALGLTAAQLMSVVMFAAGAVWLALRRPVLAART